MESLVNHLTTQVSKLKMGSVPFVERLCNCTGRPLAVRVRGAASDSDTAAAVALVPGDAAAAATLALPSELSALAIQRTLPCEVPEIVGDGDDAVSHRRVVNVHNVPPASALQLRLPALQGKDTCTGLIVTPEMALYMASLSQSDLDAALGDAARLVTKGITPVYSAVPVAGTEHVLLLYAFVVV